MNLMAVSRGGSRTAPTSAMRHYAYNNASIWVTALRIFSAPPNIAAISMIVPRSEISGRLSRPNKKPLTAMRGGERFSRDR